MSGSNFNETTNLPVTKDSNGDVIIPNNLLVGGEVSTDGAALERIANNQKDIFSAADIDIPLVSTLLYVGKAQLLPLTTPFSTPDLGTLRVLFVNRGNNNIIWTSPESALFNMENGNVAVFPGVSTNSFSTPDSTANSFSGDIDFRFDMELADWTAGGITNILGKFGGGNTAFLFRISSGGTLTFIGSLDGSTTFTAASDAVVVFANNSRHWIRVTRESSSGNVTFFTSDDGITFAQLGGVISETSGVLHDGNVALVLGAAFSGDGNLFDGRIYRMLLKSTIGSPTSVVDFNPSDYSGIGNTFTSINTDEVWTFNGDVSIAGLDGYLGWDLLDCIAVDTTNSSTLIDIRASHVSSSPIGEVVLFLNRAAFVGWGNIGTIRDAGILDIDTILISPYLNSGLKLINVFNTVITDTQWSCPFFGKTSIEISGLVDQHDYNSTVLKLVAGTAGWRIDPAIPDDARIKITGTNAATDNLLFDLRGPHGVASVSDTFSLAANANIITESITSVTEGTPRSGGFVARFNHGVIATNGPLSVFQQVTISAYSGDFTSYNVTGIITAIDTVSNSWFEIFSVIFTENDNSGEFISDATVLTSGSSTNLLEGLGITVDTINSSMYDGGTYMYNVSGSTFKINREFDETQSGSWNSKGIDHTDPRVLAFANPDFASSSYIVCGFVNNNTADMDSALTAGQFNPYVFATGTGDFAFKVSSNTERWKLVNQATATFIYLGNEPYDGNISFSVSLTKGVGGITVYTLAMSKSTDNGANFSPLEALTTIQIGNSETKSASLVMGLTAEKGDLVRPELNPTTTSDVIANFFSMYGVG